MIWGSQAQILTGALKNRFKENSHNGFYFDCRFSLIPMVYIIWFSNNHLLWYWFFIQIHFCEMCGTGFLSDGQFVSWVNIFFKPFFQLKNIRWYKNAMYSRGLVRNFSGWVPNFFLMGDLWSIAGSFPLKRPWFCNIFWYFSSLKYGVP